MQPTHPRASWAVNIIRGVRTFPELENRIATLAIEKDRIRRLDELGFEWSLEGKLTKSHP